MKAAASLGKIKDLNFWVLTKRKGIRGPIISSLETQNDKQEKETMRMKENNLSYPSFV